MTPRFVRRSAARVWAVPVPLGAAPPKPRRAARAGFGERAGAVAEIGVGRRRVLLVRTDPADCEAAGAMVAARLARVEAVAIDARGWAAADAAAFAAGAAMRAWRYGRHVTRADPDRAGTGFDRCGGGLAAGGSGRVGGGGAGG